jgi:tetratricopeptide (TPR) repeat protein
MTESAESVAREVARLHAEGKTSDALALARSAAERFNSSALTQSNLGFLLLGAHAYVDAKAAYERALFLQPQHAEARRGLAVARKLLGEEVLGDSVSVVPYTGSGRAVDLLAIVTLGRGNLVLDEFFDPALVRVTKLALELHPPDMPLPLHDLVFNAIGDADSATSALAVAGRMLEGNARPVLNPPARIADTGRAEQAARLGALPGVRVPRIERVAQNARATIMPPVLLRAPGFHAGAHFERLTSERDRAPVFEALPPGDLFAIEFIDTSNPSGEFEKYRVIAVDGALYPVHLAISHEWKVHYFSAEMERSSEYRERERQFLCDPRSAIGTRAWSALERIVEELGLHYAGVDFALDRQGGIVVFESNATMAVRYPPDDQVWSYRREAVDAVRSAIGSMLRRYSSA